MLRNARKYVSLLREIRDFAVMSESRKSDETEGLYNR